MSVSFKLRTRKSEGKAPLFARIQAAKLGVNLLLCTNIEVDVEKWNLTHTGKAFKFYIESEEGRRITRLTNEIKNAINSLTEQGVQLTSEMANDIIDGIVYREEREAQRLRDDEAKRQAEEESRMTLNKFIKEFISQIESGARQTDRGTNYAFSTIKSIRAAMNQFAYFQQDTKRDIDFKDIDMKFYYDYTAYLKGKDYSINSIGKCIKELKAILFTAESEGYHSNSKFKDKKFKGTRVEVDSIYLTREDLDKIMAADLSEYGIGHYQARDIFMVGVWTAQRVSDYNYISKDDIKYHSIQKIVDNKIVTKEFMTVEIRQKKTGAKVSVPVSAELKSILEKYDFQLPHLEDQVINRYLKDICKAAKLNELVEIETTKGGKPIKEKKHKWELVHTHTARRTGATLMYLSGMDIYDIMRITGHSSPMMLKKYIKADSLEVADKITDKYDYFN